MTKQIQLPPLLVIEDSDEDYTTLVRVLRQTRLLHPLLRCRDGAEALEYLLRQGRYAQLASTLPPALIFLDLNMPGTDGREVLEQLKKHPQLHSIPVVVLTTSANPSDIQDCYARGANAYQVKAAAYENFKDDVQRTIDYWFGAAALPPVVDTRYA